MPQETPRFFFVVVLGSNQETINVQLWTTARDFVLDFVQASVRLDNFAAAQTV
jgi:hypothetical protein